MPRWEPRLRRAADDRTHRLHHRGEGQEAYARAMRVHRLAADGRAGVACRGAQALGRRGGAQPPGRVAGRGCLPCPHRLGSGQFRHPAALRPAVARHAAGQGRAVARCHLPSPLRLRRGRRHGGRRNDGHVTVLTPRTPHTRRGALPCSLISKASAQTVDTRWPCGGSQAATSTTTSSVASVVVTLTAPSSVIATPSRARAVTPFTVTAPLTGTR